MNWGECYNVAFSDFVENLKWETSLVGLLWQLENRLKRFRAWSRGVVNIIFFYFYTMFLKERRTLQGQRQGGGGIGALLPPPSHFFLQSKKKKNQSGKFFG